MRETTRELVASNAIASLGFDPATADLYSTEGIAALLRRGGAFLCPCAPWRLIRSVTRLFDGFGIDQEELDDSIEETLDSLVSYGDFIESRDISSQTATRLLYPTPPSYVRISDTSVMLFGIYKDGRYPAELELRRKIILDKYRLVIRDFDEEVRNRLLGFGTIEVKPEAWLKLPQRESPLTHESKYNQQLAACGKPGAVDEILLLDSVRSVRFYRGRWVQLKKQTGRFVARRPQPYGADLWCYVAVENGIVTKLLDLPLTEHRWRPCDEAWHLQQAKDAVRAEPQVFRVRQGSIATESIVDFFSPVPMWARRRWDHIGKPVPSAGSLFSYTFPSTQCDAEMKFAQETMWMVRQDESKK